MTHEEKIKWMAVWCAENGLRLTLEGECGFGRECVGVLSGDNYPDYEWYDDTTYDRLDQNGEVWTPPDAYHKHPCVAVLGRGEDAESQLYTWLKWFDDSNFTLETGYQQPDPRLGVLAFALGKHKYARMVRGSV